MKTAAHRTKRLKRLLLALVLAAALTAAAGMGLLRTLDNAAADALYLRAESLDGLVTVIGIDQRAIDEIGPLPWTRDVMAQVIELLNADPEARPAVIGIDVNYAGETDPAYDSALVEACASGGNVVVAEVASFTSTVVIEDDAEHSNRFAIDGYDPAFEALRAVAQPANINSMIDVDGVVRHGLLFVEPEGYGRVWSLAAQIYRSYCAVIGAEPVLPETAEDGFFILPFTVKPGGFSDHVSVADVLQGRVTGDMYAGRIVLIGPYSAGLQDQYITAIDHGNPMFGVEIQANALTSFLNGVFLRRASAGWQLIVMFAVLFASAWFFRDRKPVWETLVWLAVVLGWLGLCWLLRQQGILLHPLWLPVGISVVYIVAVADNYIRASLERKRVTDTFSRYVDPAIIGELLKEGADSLALGGKLCDVAVLFVDIRGFTSMSEKLTPQEVVSILNRYLTLTTECIMRYHGTLDKFVGDCTMAIWNAPVEQDDYIMKACRAALDMVEASGPLAEELEKIYGRKVAFGVGVHCGKAVVGNIGAEMRMDFTAIGDTVNTASRLEANAPGGKIYISRDVADALGDRIRTTSLGSSIRLKGKSPDFEILTLDGLNEGA